MDERQKPFSCTVEGCEMTFTNVDHLNWHHKKHDMVLNLGLANKNAEVADQTPTPTRFIRNCEEVGLFQDLQNVNPFDETFKKAVESAKSGILHVPAAASNDDTLHTPHIFPQIESTATKYTDKRNDNQSAQSNDFCITNITRMTSIEDSGSDECYDLTIDDDSPVKSHIKTKHNDLKSKLKETIQNKVKTPIVITPVPIERLTNKITYNKEESSYKKQKADKNVTDEKLKIREMNRAAQLRCRKRKQVQRKQMEEEMKILKIENTVLKEENQNYKHKFYALKELLVSQQTDNNATHASFLAKVEKILNSTAPTSKNTTPSNKRKIARAPLISPAVPIPIIQPPPGSTPQNPLLIQVLGTVQQLAVSVLPNQ